MIYLLDTSPTLSASYYAVDHLNSVTREGLQVLCDATRVLTEECRIHTLERRMKDNKADVKPELYFSSLERRIPLHEKNVNDPLVLWIVEDQDAWDWMLEFVTDLTHEAKHWDSKGPVQDDLDALYWVRINALRPVHAGRIVKRRILFPLPERVPKEFTTPDLFAPDVPDATKLELTIRAFRLMYWTKYRKNVTYTKHRKPWWWVTFDRTLEPVLASDEPGK